MLAIVCFLISCGSEPAEAKVSSEPIHRALSGAPISSSDVALTHCRGGTKNAFFELASEKLGLCFETKKAKFDFSIENPIDFFLAQFGGGLALADIDNDGSLELYVSYSLGIPGELFSYREGVFEKIKGNRGIEPTELEYGGYFIDLNADGWKDFLSVQRNGVESFLNDGSGYFHRANRTTGIHHRRSTVSMAAADIELDGDLDLLFGHWGTGWRSTQPLSEYLWLNNGQGRFADYSGKLPIKPTDGSEHSFTPTFADINGDGFPDLLLAGDFRSSQVLLNVDGQVFEDVTSPEITDENGMGAAVADFDQDGDMDWFVSSIYGDPAEFGTLYSGNRFYFNSDGEGYFVDRTNETGTRIGGWGWGSCAADFNNDGLIDLFHTNGSDLFVDDRSVLFIADGKGSFEERSREFGINHTDQGRGVLCHDLNEDGKVDILIANNGKSPTVYLNRASNPNHYLQVDLVGLEGNADAVGARVTVVTEFQELVQEVRLGTSYLSQGLTRLHFGLGDSNSVEFVVVEWPDFIRSKTRVDNVDVDQFISIEQPEPTQYAIHVVDGSGTGLVTPGEHRTVTANQPPEGFFFSHWSTTQGASFGDRFARETTVAVADSSVTVHANYLPSSIPVSDASVARLWNEVLLQAIRSDYARPPVHARNLFHISAAIYDLWSLLNRSGSTWLVNNQQGSFSCPVAIDELFVATDESIAEAISFAAFSLIKHRFAVSPGLSRIVKNAHVLMDYFEFDADFVGVDYTTGSSAALGNYVAKCYVEFGMTDGANEEFDYRNLYYKPLNPALEPHKFGNPSLADFDRWQPLALRAFIDQSGNPSPKEPEFIGAEWGSVWPFALTEHDLSIYQRDETEYWVYHDPGPPPSIDGIDADFYKWGFGLVAQWSSHLDASDGVEIDISPANLGGVGQYPSTFEEYRRFYEQIASNTDDGGYDFNPVTGEPYIAQVVPRGDYTRTLAEFWADGPDSETPPGHWFVIMNEVNDHPALVRKLGGSGPELSQLEWDVKSYFALGGAMHDAAIAAWGVKGWYDYIRPISALRGMAERGQSSDPTAPSYDSYGLLLVDGFIELVDEQDALSGEEGENVGEVKFLAWRGPDAQVETNVAWVLAKEWWPYQRPTFVTPPFAGYVSGHSTFSRAAAETLATLTGSEFFPGGSSGFEIEANEFLQFERGPTTNLTLQWATYRDAADQCALSRIWGGIHPPVDDIRGRVLGITIGRDAVNQAIRMFADSN